MAHNSQHWQRKDQQPAGVGFMAGFLHHLKGAYSGCLWQNARALLLACITWRVLIVVVCDRILGLCFEILFDAWGWQIFMTFFGRWCRSGSSNKEQCLFVFKSSLLLDRLLHRMLKQLRVGIWGSGTWVVAQDQRCKICWEGGVRAWPGWGIGCLGLNRCIPEKRHRSLILCFYLKKPEKYESHIFVNVIFEINRVESNCWNKEGVTVMSTNHRDVNVSFDLISYLFPNIVFW